MTAGDHSFQLPSGVVADWSGPARFRYATTVAPATWACADASRAAVDCVTGPVRSAVVTLTEPHSPTAAYQAVLNPEHVLDVRDVAGNPARRLQVYLGQEQSAV